MTNSLQDNRLAVYIHWPFCKSKCPYCDFNSHVQQEIDSDEWQSAYLKEIDFYKERLKDRQVTSIFFGGGTPSLIPAGIFGAIIDRINFHWEFSKDIEITFEANPTSIEIEKFKDFKAAGANRVSVGIQSLRPDSLKFLGREHSVSEALEAIDVAKNTFDRFSFDLIYARPEQTIKEWESELKEALKYAGNHLSLYQLTIEKGTPFYSDFRDKKFLMPNQELSAKMYELTDKIMENAGLLSYEISNYAKPGQESLHNLTYWNYGEYLGIGPGAHGRLKTAGGREATMCIHNPSKWLESIQKNGNGLQTSEKVEGEDMQNEILLMGLRTNQGVPKEKLSKNIERKIEPLIFEEFVEFDSHLRATKKGRMVLGSIVEKLAA